MQDLLKKITKAALLLGDNDFTDIQQQTAWIGHPATDLAQIELAEKRLDVKFPPDYRAFLLLTNGFEATSLIDPRFMPVEEVELLKNIDPDLIEIWRETGNEDIADQLAGSICVAGIGEEQHFFLIPPTAKDGQWQYWKFAHWIPGEEAHTGLKAYFQSVLDFLEETIQQSEEE